MRKKTEGAISNNESQVSLGRLFVEFFKIGLFTIGGGAAMLPQLQQVIDEKGWMEPAETLDAIALSQSLPGLIAINVGTYVGFRKRGLPGAIAATVGVALPAFFAIIVALALLDIIGDSRIVEGAFMGVKAAVCGLIIVTAVKLIRQMSTGGDKSGTEASANLPLIVFNVVMCAGALVAVAVFGITAVLVILAGIVAGIFFYRIAIMRGSENSDGGSEGER